MTRRLLIYVNSCGVRGPCGTGRRRGDDCHKTIRGAFGASFLNANFGEAWTRTDNIRTSSDAVLCGVWRYCPTQVLEYCR